MSVIKADSELNIHKENAISKLSKYIDELITSDGIENKKKADILCYWLSDYTQFIKREGKFSSKKLKRYKRGDILKVHLGFRIGSEEGGLHYAAVVENDNPISSPVITVVPLTSVKGKTDNLPNGNIYLGNEIFNQISLKGKTLLSSNKIAVEEIKDKLMKISSEEELEMLNKQLDLLESKMLLMQKTVKESEKMKRGSIALVNQIVTISKIRIYDPKSSGDVLSGIRLSNVNLDKIDKCILSKFTKNSHKSNKVLTNDK